MAEDLKEQKCPACGAPLRFDPESGRSVCDWCGSSFEIPQGRTEELPTDHEAPLSDEINVYNCLSCGAEIITDAVTASVNCPYCGNNIVISDKVSGGLRPDGIIPFRIDRKRLPDAVKEFYKDKPLLPKHFFDESSLKDVVGVYVPFWLYGCDFSGRVEYEGYKDSSHREGDYIISERKNYRVVRDASMRFTDIPVDGSSRLDDALMDSVEPWDFSGVVPFNMSYLSGFCAERFDKASDEVKNRADERMTSSAVGLVDAGARAGYTGISRTRSGLRAHKLTTKYELLPVYTFSVDWHGKEYSFAMNGQTGKVVGDLPISKGKKMLLRWGVFAGVFALVLLILSFLSC